MHCEKFQQGEVLMKKGEEGDKMYISFQGRLGVYLKDNFEEEPIAWIQPFKAVGERALEKQGDRRTATIIAMDPGETICLALNKEDFAELVGVSYRKFIFAFRDNS
jgi:CRP-like cAMP-binding protein